MKLKHLMVVSLILAIIAIGSVSASEISDELAVSDGSDTIVESALDDGDALSGYKDYDDVEIYINDEVNTNENSGSGIASVYDYDKLNGTVTLSIDNVQYFTKSFTTKDYDYECEIDISDVNLPESLQSGSHNIVLSYLKNGVSKPYTFSQTSNFTYHPNIYPEEMNAAFGQTAYIFIEGLPGTSGTATVYYESDLKTPLATASIVDGKAMLSINGLKKGGNELYLNMTVNGHVFSDYVYINAREVTPGYSAGTTSSLTVGSNAVVTFAGSNPKGLLYVMVDGKDYKMLVYEGGAVSEDIVGLAVGSHIVTVQYLKGNTFFLKNFNVNVKAPDKVTLTLKKATVKKSAKKLTLQATLKINGKAVKGKQVVFKFNGKTYKAKTSAKGIAKATVKSSVLKKLSVGKKVKYQATYDKTTVKKTAKVKK